MSEDEKYWDRRSETYRGLDLIKDKRTAYRIVDVIKKFGLSKPLIIDVGCGPGVITKVIRENIRHSRVVGLDLSEKMINAANRSIIPGLSYTRENFFNMDKNNSLEGFFNKNNLFLRFTGPDLILMSLFLHHLVDGGDKKAVEIAISMIRRNGYLVIVEAIPPDESIFDEYERMFRVKEKRNCYNIHDLCGMLSFAGFYQIKKYSYRFKIGLRGWLNDETLSDSQKSLIYNLHTNASSSYKKAYNMTALPGGDYMLSCKMAIVHGRKR